nr:hypothetical protein [Solanum melongena]WMB97154.1 hypothetical protein [Solanum aethiopicum]
MRRFRSFRTSQHVKQKVVHLFGLILKFFSEPRQHSHSKRIWVRPCFGEKFFLEKLTPRSRKCRTARGVCSGVSTRNVVIPQPTAAMHHGTLSSMKHHRGGHHNR